MRIDAGENTFKKCKSIHFFVQNRHIRREKSPNYELYDKKYRK